MWIVESENECSFEQFAATSGLLLQRSTQLSSSSTTITKSDTTKCEFSRTKNVHHLELACVVVGIQCSRMENDCCMVVWESVVVW